MNNYIYTNGVIIQSDNPEHYCKVSTMAIRVKKVKGGWAPINPRNWGGLLPIKAKLAKG